MIRVVRVRTRDTMVRPDIIELLKRAVAATRYPALEWPMLAAELVRRIDQPGLGVFVALKDDAPAALAIGVLPDSPLMLAPQVPLVYSEGGPHMLSALYKAGVKWLKDEGYSGFIALAFRHRPQAWARRFRGIATVREIGSQIEVRF